MKAKHYTLLSTTILLGSIWYFMYFKANESLATCIILSVLAIRLEAVALAQTYIGQLFAVLENTVNSTIEHVRTVVNKGRPL